MVTARKIKKNLYLNCICRLFSGKNLSQVKCTQGLAKRTRKKIRVFNLHLLASPVSQFVHAVAVVMLLFWF